MIHLIISGDVQGVGFRQFIKHNASNLYIKGWVKNMSNGDVEVILQGSKEKLDKMVEFCRKGPFLADVKSVKVEEVEDRKFADFQIIKD